MNSYSLIPIGPLCAIALNGRIVIHPMERELAEEVVAELNREEREEECA